MNREELSERVRALPAFRDLEDQLVELAVELAEEMLHERLQALIAKPLLETRHPKTTPSQPKPKAAKATGAKRKPNSCSKCGASGFTAATCGKTHNVTTEEPEVVSKPPPLSAEPIASPRSKRLPARAAASTEHSTDDVPLHKVVAFTF